MGNHLPTKARMIKPLWARSDKANSSTCSVDENPPSAAACIVDQILLIH